MRKMPAVERVVAILSSRVPKAPQPQPEAPPVGPEEMVLKSLLAASLPPMAPLESHAHQTMLEKILAAIPKGPAR